MNSLRSGSGVMLVVVLSIIIIIAGPWLLFWSIETIAFAAGFSITIPMTFKTWLAAMVFLALVNSNRKK